MEIQTRDLMVAVTTLTLLAILPQAQAALGVRDTGLGGCTNPQVGGTMVNAAKPGGSVIASKTSNPCVASAVTGGGHGAEEPAGTVRTNVCTGARGSQQDGDIGLPVTPVIVGNGGSWFQLYQSYPGHYAGERGYVYASWGLVTNNLDNGADIWAFGWEIGEAPFTGVSTYRGATCQVVGLASYGFDYFIDAGAMGWVDSSSCTWTLRWEVSVGVTVDVPGASATLGGSLSCTGGGTLDTESLLRDAGRAETVCVECIIQE